MSYFIPFTWISHGKLEVNMLKRHSFLRTQRTPPKNQLRLKFSLQVYVASMTRSRPPNHGTESWEIKRNEDAAVGSRLYPFIHVAANTWMLGSLPQALVITLALSLGNFLHTGLLVQLSTWTKAPCAPAPMCAPYLCFAASPQNHPCPQTRVHTRAPRSVSWEAKRP